MKISRTVSGMITGALVAFLGLFLTWVGALVAALDKAHSVRVGPLLTVAYADRGKGFGVDTQFNGGLILVVILAAAAIGALLAATVRRRRRTVNP